jgi:chromosome segregation ATPase
MNLTEKISRLWSKWRGHPVDQHEQQLMRLYWNRAELKKELSDLQNERDQLLAKVESHQATVRRAGEQVDALAAYLGRPEVGVQALLYFQLRNLWLGNSRKLTQFVSELRSQQEERERRRFQADGEAKRALQIAEMDERLLNAQSIAGSLDARRKLLERKLASMKWLWHYWKRREIQAEIAQVKAQWEVAATNVTDLADERAAIGGAPLEEYPGLSPEGRRIVNTAAIAYAEWLITNLPMRELAPLARQAISAQIFDVNLGSAQECTQRMDVVRAALEQIDRATQNLASLREPTERIRSKALYRSESDTVPLAESLGEVAMGLSPEGKPVKVNILTEDYWSLSQVLIH